MARIALNVTLTAKPGKRDKLLERLHQHAAATLALERGCMNFDILLPLGSDDDIRLYEVYLSEDALTEHRQSAHLAAFREDTKDWVAARQVVECELIVNRR